MSGMSRKPPALRAAVADLERALAGRPAESAQRSDEATEPEDADVEVADEREDHS
jgi:hypothetical protein